jgi:hypothetical protein
MYFNPFPKTEYSLGSKTETVVDIFRKVAISQNNTDSIFTEELVGDSDNVESLAEKYYGDASLSWIILLTNNIIDPMSEFVLSTKNFDSLINTKYSGSIFYFEENVHLQQGDILIFIKPVNAFTPYDDNKLPSELQSTDLDLNQYCFVNSYNNEFRYARVTNIVGSFDTTTKVAAYRKINNKLELITFTKKLTTGGAEQDAFVLPIKLVNDYYKAPLYIYNATNQIISPYRRYFSSTVQDDYILLEANGLYTNASDINAFRSSLLYQMIILNTSISGLSVKTILQDLTEKNEKYRTIKILNKEFITPFIQTFNEMISSDNVRFRVIAKES